MSHSTYLHHDGPRATLAIHNSDWSGTTLIRVTDDNDLVSEIVLPQEAVERLVDAVLKGTVDEDELDVAARLLGIAKLQARRR